MPMLLISIMLDGHIQYNNCDWVAVGPGQERGGHQEYVEKMFIFPKGQCIDGSVLPIMAGPLPEVADYFWACYGLTWSQTTFWPITAHRRQFVKA